MPSAPASKLAAPPTANMVPFRFGILLSTGRRLKAWQHLVLEKLLQPGLARLALIIEMAPPENRAPLGQPPALLWKLYRRLCQRWAPLGQFVDGTLLHGPAEYFCWAGAPLPPSNEDTLCRLQLDFLLNFTTRFDVAALAGLAKYGVWTYRHGRWHTRFPAAPCFGEMLHGEQVVEVCLTATPAPECRPLILHAGKIATDWNYPRTLNAVLAASADWAARVCQEIACAGALSASPAGLEPKGSEAGAPPANRQCLQFLWQQFKSGLHALVDDLFYYDIWNVGIVQRPPSTRAALPPLQNVRWLPPHQPLCYIADPFSFSCQGRQYLLLEEYSYRRAGRGQVAELAFPSDPFRLVLETKLSGAEHFSYPCVITVGADTYCIPETCQANQCRLYRRQANGAWSLERVLIDQRAVVDPTVFLYNDYWWLFFTDHRAGSNLKLYAYYAADFHGAWQPHALNPLKCDVTSARPAGRPFTLAGQLYRPAQDCSRTYGGAITLNQVLALSPTAFQEQPVSQLRPDPHSLYPAGLHHLIVEDEVIIVDAKKRVFDLLFKFKQRRPAR